MVEAPDAGYRRALVIGGGIAGMSATIALHRAGFAVTLCERDPEWRVYGAGITITGPTLRAMGRLGILPEVLEQGYAADGIDICGADGRLLFEVDTRDGALDGIPSAGGILRPVLHRILSRHVLALEPELLLGVTVEALEVTEDGATAQFSDGRTARYDLVVGADGIYSQLRRRFFPETPSPRYAGQLCWRLMTARHPAIERRTFFLGGPVKVGLNPVAPDRMYMFLLEPQPEPLRRPEEGQHHLLAQLLEGFGGVLQEVRDGLGPDAEIVCRPLETVFLEGEWVRGRLVLIGDAAHATTPQLASGAGMGIEDALVLGEELTSGVEIAEGLGRFMRRRHERCRLVVDASLEIGRLERTCSPLEDQTAVLRQALAVLNQEF
ncbi:FAD-dependent oxidoreductase [Muricoccus vinaceus]|uniref:FAD-dependent oxidoreductase n=1 Tax=Muricoccus vinaceus TaxID=424704 RepID=A0ABV6IPA2_9PROT